MNPISQALPSENLRVAVGLLGSLTVVPDLPRVGQPINAHELLEAVARDMRHTAAAKRIELSLTLAARGYLVRGDRERMKQTYHNLLSNAVNYAKKGGRITVRSSCPTPDALRVEVSHGDAQGT